MPLQPHDKGNTWQGGVSEDPLQGMKTDETKFGNWIDLNAPLSEALAKTGYHRSQRVFTSRQVALIFEYLGEP